VPGALPARASNDDPLPAPGDLTAARIELTLSVAAWQFYLLDAAEKPARIPPIPEHAASAGIPPACHRQYLA
jgi:hypothetical protein